LCGQRLRQSLRRFESRHILKLPFRLTLVAIDEHQSVWCSIFLMIPSFSMALSSCCSLVFRCILHFRGASIEGFASDLSWSVALPLKLPIRSNWPGNCLLRSSMELTVEFTRLTAIFVFSGLMACIVTMFNCSQAGMPFVLVHMMFRLTYASLRLSEHLIVRLIFICHIFSV